MVCLTVFLLKFMVGSPLVVGVSQVVLLENMLGDAQGYYYHSLK